MAGMELKGKLADALNEQVTMELQASLVYRQLSIEKAAASLPGCAAWFRAQAAEEIGYAEKFVQHMVDRGVTPRIGDLRGPEIADASPLGCFEAALAHEKKVSEAIRDLYRLVRAQRRSRAAAAGQRTRLPAGTPRRLSGSATPR